MDLYRSSKLKGVDIVYINKSETDNYLVMNRSGWYWCLQYDAPFMEKIHCDMCRIAERDPCGPFPYRHEAMADARTYLQGTGYPRRRAVTSPQSGKHSHE